MGRVRGACRFGETQAIAPEALWGLGRGRPEFGRVLEPCIVSPSLTW
jgi:hypothetical protein